MKKVTRRNFIKLGGASTLLGFISQMNMGKFGYSERIARINNSEPVVQFRSDGILLNPLQYAELLTQITEEPSFIPDRYAKGGVVEKLETVFAKITGKESAIFMPTGTMANQLAIRVLSEGRSKVFVQETSHVYRDEADAAQTLHGRRLIPLAKGRATFTLDELKEAIDYIQKNEVFHTGVGAISIENPVRRLYEEVFDIEEIRKISKYAKDNNIGIHLDGARLYMASAYSGVSIREYASYFDTVYISLYKYLGAGAGAILCSNKNIIDSMHHLVKIFGGNMFQNWQYAAVALHFLEGFERRFARVKQKAEDLFVRLNEIRGIRIEKFVNGSNVHKLFVENADTEKFVKYLSERRNIIVRQIDEEKRFIPVKVNETQLNVSNDDLAESFQRAYSVASLRK